MLKYILSALSEAIIAYNSSKNHIEFISPAITTVTGYEKEQFEKNHNLRVEIVHPDDRSSVAEQLQHISFPGSVELSYRIITPKKQVKWVKEKFVSFTDETTGDKMELNILSDITENVLFQAESEQKVWFLSSLINAVGALIFRIDVKGNYTYVNDIYTRQLGYKSEDLIGHHISDFVLEDDVRAMKEAMAACLKDPGQIFHIRHRKITLDGRTRWIATDAIAVRNRNGKITEIQGVAHDITDLELSRMETADTRDNLEALIDNTSDLIWSIDREKRYVSCNTSFTTWMQQRYQIVPKKEMPVIDLKLFPTERSKLWNNYYDRALSGENFTVHYMAGTENTSANITLEISFNPIRTIDKQITGVGCFAHDITDALAKQHSIELQNEKLRKIAFLSSHQLRRPVSNLLGLVPLLDTENFANPDNQVVVDKIGLAAKDLDDVVRNIVDHTFVG